MILHYFIFWGKNIWVKLLVLFNPDLNKQAQEVIFSRKLETHLIQESFLIHQFFCVNSQKHLGMHLDETLNFCYDIQERLSKAIKGLVTAKWVAE